jgi:hypothetical protein
MRYLRNNTAVIVAVGPFIGTDGVTRKTALTITNERITLSADTDDGSAPTLVLDNVTGATSATANDLNYISGQDNAMMQMELAAADTNRLGRMTLTINDSGDTNHLPVIHEFMVLPSLVYDSLVTGGPAFPLFGIAYSGTAQSASATGIVGAAAAAFADSTLVGSTLAVYGSTQAYWQRRIITANLLSGDAYTVDTWDVTPSGTITYVNYMTPPGAAGLPSPANVTQWLGTAAHAAATAGVPVVSLLAAPTITKNVALAAFPFVMTDSTTHIPTAGATVTATRSLDGAAFAACANAVSAISNGAYKISLAATDTNANTIIFRFTATNFDDLLVTVVTQVA